MGLCESQIGGRISSAGTNSQFYNPIRKDQCSGLEDETFACSIIPRTVNDTILLDVRTLDKDAMTLAVKQLKEMDILEETSLL